MTWGANVAISAARSSLPVSQGLHRFHVMTRFGTTSLTASAGNDLASRAPLGALGPDSTIQATTMAPTSNHVPFPNTIASSTRNLGATDVRRNDVMGRGYGTGLTPRRE